jgi:hypothetical protein
MNSSTPEHVFLSNTLHPIIKVTFYNTTNFLKEQVFKGGIEERAREKSKEKTN